jgi:hypothetical protein
VGKEKGLIAFFFSFRKALSANIRDLCVIFYFMGSFVMYCSPTVCDQWSFYALRGAPCFKKKKTWRLRYLTTWDRRRS